jgi:hypothetical protein
VKISFRDVLRSGRSSHLVIHSLDQALYQVMVRIDGQEFLLTENDGRAFRRNSLNAVREALQVLPVATLTLRQCSAYDEMIGQPSRTCDNALEVPLSMTLYPPITRH